MSQTGKKLIAAAKEGIQMASIAGKLQARLNGVAVIGRIRPSQSPRGDLYTVTLRLTPGTLMALQKDKPDA